MRVMKRSGVNGDYNR